MAHAGGTDIPARQLRKLERSLVTHGFPKPCSSWGWLQVMENSPTMRPVLYLDTSKPLRMETDGYKTVMIAVTV